MIGRDQLTLNAPLSAAVAVAAVFKPGWGVEQQGHVVMETLLVTIHSGQSHVSPAFLNTSISDWACVPLPVLLVILLVAMETEGTTTFMLLPAQHIQCDHCINKIFEQATQRKNNFFQNIHLQVVQTYEAFLYGNILPENITIDLMDESSILQI
jgi:hypothetical protein